MLVEKQKNTILASDSAKILLKEIYSFQSSITYLKGKLVDEWVNQNEAGAAYIQKSLDKEYIYIVTISKRGILADFMIKKGLSDQNPNMYETIARFSPDKMLTEYVLKHLQNCSKQIDLDKINVCDLNVLNNNNAVQLSLF